MLRPLICLAGQVAFILKNRRIPKRPSKIVIMRSGGIGDVLMSTPLVKAVRLAYPQAKITYLVGEWSTIAIKGNPNVDSVMTYPDDIIFKRKKEEVDKLIDKIKAEQFDLGFILDKAWQWNALAYMAKIKFRVGFDRYGEGFANNKNVGFDGSKYELEYYRDLAMEMGVEGAPHEMQFYLTRKDHQKARQALTKLRVNKKRLVVLIPGGAKNPGQELAEKRWPAIHYAKLADSLLARKYDVVLLGGPTDKNICKEVAKSMTGKRKAHDLSGRLSLAESGAFMTHAALVVTHDSGPMHLAAAIGAPLIAIFGPTDPLRFAPPSARVVQDIKACPPCYDVYGNLRNQKRNLGLIDVERVLNEAISVLVKKKGR